MKYRVRHTTHYGYQDPVSLGHNQVVGAPRPHPGQQVSEAHLEIDPIPAVIARRRDYFGNSVTFFEVHEPHTELTVTIRFLVEVRPAQEYTASPPWERVMEQLVGNRAYLAERAFCFDSPYVEAGEDLADYARACLTPGRPLVEGVLDLMDRIHREFRYDPEATDLSTGLKEVLSNRRGVCQDFAHLQIGMLRSLGLAARYVSGYLLTTPPPGQPRLVGADASHAWLSVFCPPYGWVDFDPTNNLIPCDSHITMAWGRDYDDVSPVKGVVLGGGEQKVSVAVDVLPV
ncbi:transglutaminase family protein [bacterium CPR1]|nr:transglutaminase family protein [bacterium CPR1]